MQIPPTATLLQPPFPGTLIVVFVCTGLILVTITSGYNGAMKIEVLDSQWRSAPPPPLPQVKKKGKENKTGRERIRLAWDSFRNNS